MSKQETVAEIIGGNFMSLSTDEKIGAMAVWLSKIPHAVRKKYQIDFSKIDDLLEPLLSFVIFAEKERK